MINSSSLDRSNKGNEIIFWYLISSSKSLSCKSLKINNNEEYAFTNSITERKTSVGYEFTGKNIFILFERIKKIIRLIINSDSQILHFRSRLFCEKRTLYGKLELADKVKFNLVQNVILFGITNLKTHSNQKEWWSVQI